MIQVTFSFQGFFTKDKGISDELAELCHLH